MDDQKLLSIGDELIESVKGEFQSNATFRSFIDQHRGNYVACISWKLGNDPTRPNKLSRIIAVVISREALEDLPSESHREQANKRFKKHIHAEVKQFKPKHNKPSPPIEEWLITTKILNG